ncbi:uncharacterized protein LOC119459751 [Dermacentor silvarum]|uniref:uncharacterized protein LOC119459751 n=1 Tax=Dermacentor silvarum TaxID=543639 RepID=UPI0018985C7F|nr:uncharacterized protein LOC119459751 [Dermacentor silvarum]
MGRVQFNMSLLTRTAVFEIFFFSAVCAIHLFEEDSIGFPFERNNRDEYFGGSLRSYINEDYLFELPRPNRYRSTGRPRPVYPSFQLQEEKCGRTTCPRGTRCGSFNVYCFGGNCPPIYYCQPKKPEPRNPYLNSRFMSL